MQTKNQTNTTGINVSINELIALRTAAVHDFQKHKKISKHTGQRLSVIRGRGIEFHSTREYQSGDDIRNMAWRLTARSLKPYVKVYQEEKERPVWLALDLSPSLYFGTRCMFKSVRCIKQAAELGWGYLLKRERIGAVIAEHEKVHVYKPQAGERNFLSILEGFCNASVKLPEFTAKNNLTKLLIALQNEIRSGNLIFIFSDFFDLNAENKKLILHLSERAQVILNFIFDPFEAEPPPPHQYLISDGQARALFNMDNIKVRQQYQEQFQQKLADLTTFARKNNIVLQQMCTDQGFKGKRS